MQWRADERSERTVRGSETTRLLREDFSEDSESVRAKTKRLLEDERIDRY